jgi:hypothetical protein
MSSDESNEFYRDITTVDQIIELGKLGLGMKDGAPIHLAESLADGTLVKDLGRIQTIKLRRLIRHGSDHDLECLYHIMDTDELEEALATGIVISGLYTADASAKFIDLYPPNILMDKLIKWLAKSNSVPVNANCCDVYDLLYAYGK